VREEVRFFSARALTTGAAVTTLVDEIALACANTWQNTARRRHGHTRSGEVRMLVSTKPDDRRRMTAASSSSTRNLSRMRMREQNARSGEKRELLKGLSEPVRTLEPATGAPAEVATKHSDFAPG
jgi:hypothetical protein